MAIAMFRLLNLNPSDVIRDACRSVPILLLKASVPHAFNPHMRPSNNWQNGKSGRDWEWAKD